MRTKPTVRFAVTPEVYGDYIAGLVKADYPDPLAITNRVGVPVRSWEDLHTVVDANEYMLEAEERFGVDILECMATPANVDAFNDYCTKSVLRAMEVLGWMTPEVRVKELARRGW